MAGEPREFGPYRLIRRLGVGGMAETFEAARLGEGGFEQRVCLKRVLPAFGDDEEFVARFQREARLAARLRHTHIVGVIDAGDVDGSHYMALELVDGVDLRSLLRSSPEQKLDPETVALIAIDLAYALEHAHATLVHRDISPSNILLSRSGEAKLADFGIAKAIENAKVTASRTAKGKIPYMAPEQMRAESVDGRADLFSLGVVMFEAVGGVRPFDGMHDVETMQRVLDGKRLRLEDVAPGTPSTLAAIIDRLLVIDRESRTRSAQQLLEELAEIAPPPSTRRALASRIETQCGGPETRLHVRVSEERDTELTALPAGVERARSAKPPPRRRLALALPALFVAAVLVAVFMLVQRHSPETAPAAEAASPATVADAAAELPPPPPAAPNTQSKPSATTISSSTGTGEPDTQSSTGASVDPPLVAPTPPPVAPARGWVRVVVEPWGNVWIDGRYFGRAPVRARLNTGRHVIQAGRELPSERRVVRVQPGARKEVQLTLGAE